jgi:hypothetical protein
MLLLLLHPEWIVSLLDRVAVRVFFLGWDGASLGCAARSRTAAAAS